MSQPLSILLAGAGSHGFNCYIRDVFPRLAERGKIRIAGVVDPSAENRNKAVEALVPIPAAAFQSLDAALSAEVPDVVVIATPYFAHEEPCLKALAAGTHLFIEKPVSDTLESSCRILQAVRTAKKKAAVNMSARYESEKINFAHYLNEGTCGDLEYIYARLSWNHEQHASYRSKGSDPYLLEAGVHVLEMLKDYAGGRAKTVYNLTWPSPGTAFKGNASSVLSMEMENNVRCVLEGSWTTRAGINTWRNEYIRADGNRGSLELDHRRIRILSGSETDAQGLNVRETWPIPRPLAATEYLLDAFCDWVSGKTNQHPTDLEENIHTMALLFAAIESGKRKQAVTVAEVLEQAMASASAETDKS